MLKPENSKDVVSGKELNPDCLRNTLLSYPSHTEPRGSLSSFDVLWDFLILVVIRIKPGIQLSMFVVCIAEKVPYDLIIF